MGAADFESLCAQAYSILVEKPQQRASLLVHTCIKVQPQCLLHCLAKAQPLDRGGVFR